MRKNVKEHNPPKGSMYMFIEFGRLGCKHVIYLGDVCVRANKFMCLTYTGSIGGVHMMHNHYHFGSSMWSMLEILCICLLLNFKNFATEVTCRGDSCHSEVTSLAALYHSEVTSLVEPNCSEETSSVMKYCFCGGE